MEILDNLFGPFSRDLQRSMSRTTERHNLLTQNLANINTPGYKRKDLDFGIALEDELNRGSGSMGNPGGTASEPSDGNVRLDGNSVDLEREVMAIAETELHYQALTDITSRYFQGLQNVIREGR